MPNNSKIQGALQDEAKNVPPRGFSDEPSLLPFEQNQNNTKNQTLSQGQKITVVFLAFFGLAVMVLWAVQTKNRLMLTHSNNKQETITQTSSCAGLDCPQTQAELKNKDTDNDGLSDWDELQLYNTSPYLEDTDSDGYSDGEEVKSGNDPNCPQGRVCGAVGNFKDENSTVPQKTNFSDLQKEMANMPQEPDSLKNNTGYQNEAAAIRQLLVSSGMDKNILDQISDEELIRQYTQVVEEAMNNK